MTPTIRACRNCLLLAASLLAGCKPNFTPVQAGPLPTDRLEQAIIAAAESPGGGARMATWQESRPDVFASHSNIKEELLREIIHAPSPHDPFPFFVASFKADVWRIVCVFARASRDGNLPDRHCRPSTDNHCNNYRPAG